MEAKRKFLSLGKKCITFVIGLALLLSAVITPMAASPVGDLNGDNTVSAPDLSTLTTVLLSGIKDITYDINGDGVIDIRDLVRLKKKLAYATITVSAPVDAVDGKVPAGGVTLSGGGVSAFVPEGVLLEDGVDTLTLTVTPLISLSGELSVGDSETITPYDVHISGISKNNTVAIIIDLGVVMPKYLNIGNYRIYHVENGENVLMTLVDSKADLTAHNQFTYDPNTGAVTVAMATFSEVAMVSNLDNAWNGNYNHEFKGAGTEDDPYIISTADELAGFGQIVGGMNGQTRNSYSDKFFKLISDINLGDAEKDNVANKIFHPIGYYYTDDNNGDGTTGDYYSTVYSFEGTFDGNGHTISNFYQNTWEIKGDYSGNYYSDAMGLFGYVVNGTVKNLTVDNFSSDGEFTPTGVIAAYAVNSNFENIAITNCNPRVYNTGNGGIVGIGGNSDDSDTYRLTFTNITIDNTNKITALWGSWDVACGGLVGMFRGAGHVNMTNCHVAAQMDVYNDVCGNYQYYWYRYSGMMIGTNKNMVTDKDGYTVPETEKFHAEGCTVHFGDWNDYYYCELVDNSIASYTHDHQFSRLVEVEAVNGTTITYLDGTTGTVPASGRANYVVVNGDDSTENATCYHFKDGEVWTHDMGGAEETVDVNGDGVINESDLKEDKQHIYLPFNQLFTGYGWGVKHIPVYNGEDYAFAGIEILDRITADSVEKFAAKFDNDSNTNGVQTNFLYRIGNANPVSLGSLFEENANLGILEVIDSNVIVTIEAVDKNTNVSGTYTKSTTGSWEDGSIQFSGTGVVKVIIQDYYFCTPTTLLLEVVDAYNSTKAASAPYKYNNQNYNVVLLNNISGTFTVSNGYTFYGNGFTVTLPTTSVQNVGNGFTGYISIGASQDDGIANGGNLDNVRIEGPVYPEMYIYRDQAKITDNSDADYGDGYNMRYFKNSVIVYGGNCTISNSYISGSRTALCLRGGNNVVIENTTLSGGAYANMQICAGSNVTLRDLTTVQVDVPDSYGKGKTAHGLGIAVDSAVVDLYIEGELNQYNWLCEDQWNSIVPSTYQSSFPDFFGNSKFNNYWHYLNGGTAPYVNMAFIYACNWDTSKIHDNRTTKEYDTCDATIAGVAGGVYSKVTTVGDNAITDANLNEPDYTSTGFNPVAPKFDFDNTANNDDDDASDAADTYCVYDETTGTLKIGVTGDSKTLDLSGITVTKNGTDLDYTAYLNGTQINGNSVTIKTADGAKQTLTFKATSNDAGYDKDGNPIEGSIEYSWTVSVEMAVLAYPAPVWNMGGTYKFDTSNCVYAYYQTSQGYGEAVPIYEGIKVNYYNKSGNLVELDLSGTTTLPTGSNNSNSNAFTYTLSDGSTLTMKFSSGWKSGATTHQFTTYNNKVYIYPQSLDNDNYIRAKTTNQDFDVNITYNFTDPNGQSTGNQTMQWYNAKASNGSVKTVQWKTFDSTNGKECVTPDTLITLADGSQVRVDSLKGDEMLLVWNLETGSFDTAPIMFVDSEEESEFEVIKLYFSDGTEVKVISEHGFWDYDLNKYVYLDRYAENYIGHTFAKHNGTDLVKVQLVDVVLETQTTTAWSPVTVGHLCYFVNGMLSMPGGVGGLFNIFEVDAETMTYDYDAIAKDIETYGLFTYEELNAIAPLSEEMFYAAGGQYLKISIGKGNLTIEELKTMINRYSKFI